MTDKQIQQLVDRYIQGQASETESRMLESWYAKEERQSTWTIDQHTKEDIINAIEQNIKARSFTPAKRSTARYWLAAAACLLVTLSVWVLVESRLSSTHYPVEYTVISSAAGKTLNVTLDDGSSITLNSATVIKYPKKFDSRVRRVIIVNGEAFFDVKHENERPFIVESGGINTQVLGTAFNIASYKNSETIRVTVNRGKVSVTRDAKDRNASRNNQVILLPDDQVVINRSGGDMVKHKVVAKDISGWTVGRIMFTGESMADVASILDSRFKTHISFSEDTIKRTHVSGGFEASDSIDDILFALGKANHFVYTKKGQQILIHFDK